MTELILTGCLLGAVSSLHCIGMCGPIALSLPVHYLAPQRKAPGIFLYNIGRITIYSVLGLLFGFAGRQFYLGGLQKLFSIGLGSLLLLILFASFINRKLTADKWLQGPTRKLQQFIGSYLKKKKLSGLFILGMANGLLPCGMVYFAITGALAAGTVAGGVVFMAAYGAGTFPAMFALSFFGTMMSMKLRNGFKKVAPFIMLIMGVLLILRGLNLNIPYVSPFIPAAFENVVPCH